MELLKSKVLKIIEDLQPEDVQGHIWWNRFLEMIEQTPTSGNKSSLC